MQIAYKYVVGAVAFGLCLVGALVAFSQEPQALEPVQAIEPKAFNYEAETALRLDEISADLAALKEQIAQTTTKPVNKGWSPVKVNARLFMDYIISPGNDWDGIGAINPSLTTPYDSAKNWFGMREARIGLSGTGYGFLDYKLELGFEKDNAVSYKDIFLGIKNVPILEYVRIGHQYVEDAGSEICNGTTNYTFMEAPAPAGQHFTSRRVGVSSRHLFADNRGRLFLGAYNAQNVSDSHYVKDDNQGIMLNSRLTYAPYFCYEGRNMFLVGAYYRATYLSEGTLQIARPRPGGWNVYDVDRFATYNSDQQQKAGFETVYQRGRLSLQTDFFVQQYSDVHDATVALGDQTCYGGFVMVRWFLTKDFRKYNQQNACWNGVDVHCPFRCVKNYDKNYMCGPGAWEVAGMYGFYDNFRLDSTKGDMKPKNQQVGVALNWYWNPNVKWAVNYVHDMTDVKYANVDYSPTGDYLGMSCRIAF